MDLGNDIIRMPIKNSRRVKFFTSLVSFEERRFIDMKLKEINFHDIDKSIFENKNIIYGAGYNGKLLYEMLKSRGVAIDAFYDDDRNRWGDFYCDKKILSIDELVAYDKNITNIFISSMYIKQIADKICKLGFKEIFIALDMLLEKDTDTFNFSEYQNNYNYIHDLEYLIDAIQDSQTKKYFELIKKTVMSGKALHEITDLYCDESQYFLNCFKGKLNGKKILDAGAYTGDTVRELAEKDIYPARVYCFEADLNNYRKLEIFREQNSRVFELICENYALWNVCTKLGMKFANYNARIDSDAEETTVEAVTIDDYFENIKIGFIKMDIEGAERKALEGGIKVIKRDRPILAISIYHSLEDIVEIPKMLMKALHDYTYIVRHHSYTYSETILYGIPNELA